MSEEGPPEGEADEDEEEYDFDEVYGEDPETGERVAPETGAQTLNPKLSTMTPKPLETRT